MKLAWVVMLVGLGCAPVAAFGARSIRLTPVPGGNPGYELYECGVTFLDMMSPDGTMVTVNSGYSHPCDQFARVWSPGEGTGTIEAPGFGGTVVERYVRGGGALVMLREFDDEGEYVGREYGLWDSGGVERVGDGFPGTTEAPWTVMFDASADRSRFVGTILGGTAEVGDAFIWRRGEPPLVFEPLEGYTRGYFSCISEDGTVAAGASDSDAGGPSHAWVWREGEGVVALGFLPGAITSFARAMSADGGVVVGSSWAPDATTSDGLVRPFRWTGDGGMEAIDVPPAAYGAWEWVRPEGVTADGSLVWGLLEYDWEPPSEDGEFVWTEASGMLFASDYLTIHLGLDMVDPAYGCAFVLERLIDVSDDGRTWYVRGDFAGGCGARGYYLLRVPPVCEGDLDGNGATDVADFAVFEGEFGQAVTPGRGADLDWNGVVDVLDFAVWLGDFGCVGE